MSKLGDNDIYVIDFQDDVDSYPLRENFANIKSAVNDTQNQLDNISGAESTNEVVQGRDYFASLRERVRSGNKDKNFKITGGAVTVNSLDNSKVDISAFEGIINGVGVNISAGTSASISQALPGKHRIDVVVANSDNTFSVVSGSDEFDTLNPLVPAIAVSQLPLAILYLSDTSPVNLTGNIYELSGQNTYPIIFVGADTVLRQGNYVFGDLIIKNNSVKLFGNFDGSLFNTALNRAFFTFKIYGNFELRDGTIEVDTGETTNFDGNTNAGGDATDVNGASGGAAGFRSFTSINNLTFNYSSNIGGDGYAGYTGGGTIYSGGGGGGAGSVFNAGGDGGDGKSAAYTVASNLGPTTQAVNEKKVLFCLTADNIIVDGNITLSGEDGADCPDTTAAGTDNAAGGGSGGGAGGTVIIAAKNDFTLTAGATISVEGGDGGAGGDCSGGTVTNLGGGGGGGGAGGAIVVRYKNDTISGTLDASKGTGGSGGTATGGTTTISGDNGSDGGDGIVSSAVYTDNTTLDENIFPLNMLGLNWDIF